MNGEIAAPMGEIAMKALGLNIDQRFALFHNVICGDEMKEEFGIDVTGKQQRMQKILRFVAGNR